MKHSLCLRIVDEFVMAVGPRGHQWLLRLDASGHVVQRRALYPMKGLAAFIGADLKHPAEFRTVSGMMDAWRSAEHVDDVAHMLVK